MARTADHDQRRRQMVEAAMRISLKDGIAAVTIARVAKDAGVSVGLVQHYFAAKDRLVEALYAEMLGRADSRIGHIVEKGETAGHSIRRMASDALAQLLPLDPARRSESQVRCEFAALALRNGELREVAAAHDEGMLVRLARVIDNGRMCGEVRRSVDTSAAATHLLAVVTGACELALRRRDADLVSVVDGAVAEVFAGTCRRHRSGAT